jgi:hypothetical protein
MISQLSLINVIQPEDLALKLIKNIIEQLNNLARLLVRIITQEKGSN